MDRNNDLRNGIPESILKKITIVQALALALYGISAIALYAKMHTYELSSVSAAGPIVHFSHLIVMGLGWLQIIYRVIKQRKINGFAKSREFLTLAILTAAGLMFGQANTVYTTTSGGSLLGFISYFFRALSSGKDPIDSFVYGSMTVPKYILVTLIGIAAAAYTITESRGEKLQGITKDFARIGKEKIFSTVSNVKNRSQAVLSQETISPDTIPAAPEANYTADTEMIYSAPYESIPAAYAEVTNTRTHETIPVRPAEPIYSVKKKISTRMKVIIGSLLVIVIGAGVSIYALAFSVTGYSLDDYTTDAIISGYDGEATASSPTINYEAFEGLTFEESYHLSDVLDTVTYKITPNSGLSNGDKVTIEADYDEALGRRYGIKLTDLKREMVVTTAAEPEYNDDYSYDGYGYEDDNYDYTDESVYPDEDCVYEDDNYDYTDESVYPDEDCVYDYEYDDYDEDEMIFEDSSLTRLSRDEIETRLYSMTGTPVAGTFAQDAINEIFARNGNIFENDEYQDYYESKSWYTPVRKLKESDLSSIEKHNIELLRQYR